MTTTKLSQVLVWVTLGASLAAGCGSVSPLSADGAAGQGGTTDAAGEGGTTGSAGHGGGSGSTGGGGQGGTTGAAGQGGGSGSTGGGGQGGMPPTGYGGAGGGVAGTGGGPVSCGGLGQTECQAKPGCRFAMCPSCSGGPSNNFCYNPSQLAVDCFCSSPPACSALGEAACLARTDCRTDYCPTCTGKGFLRCTTTADGPPACAQPRCAAPCSSATTLDACEARTDCHSVFQDPGTCGCAASGCCAKFSFCAAGDQATCTGTPVCKSLAPFCESPYVVAYAGSCYEGCVKKTDCAP
jgi:hypothetical protein